MISSVGNCPLQIRRLLLAVGLCFLSITSLPVAAIERYEEAGIIAGYKYGTSMTIARDIQLVSALHGERVRLVSSKGGPENIFAILEGKQSQLAMAEEYYLNYLQKQGNTKLENLRYVLPLHTSDLHIIANKNITHVDQLQGKTISIGLPAGSTYLVARNLFKSLGIEFKEVNLTPYAALDQVKKDQLDAMVYLSGAPVRLFEENIDPGDKLNLLEIPYSQGNLSGLRNNTIKEGTYEWLRKDVNTKASRVLLMAYNFSPKSKEISRCVAARRAYRSTLINLDFLKNHGHSKWSEVAINMDDLINKRFPVNRYHCTWRNTF
ncbi:TAXI family TRAP transporter solute-binding subunit [Oceanospirillum sediminis]|uniref:TAXI family TRAP transporter solute-binding subunit n=1 Tax=Oceanospirillum sediminis TaxID=2760088 RepID=A0A839IKX2_9GAMM|nr:TAXI family TRAP transporter solute-binding subunit [Oceanospirillum sediminis]MBB1485192.1 hypothetical protein [Oceanospirillum sediminis]